MKKQFLEAGKIVALHGLKGEMRLKPWSDDASFLQGFTRVFLDAQAQQERALLSARPHGNVTLIKLEGVEDAQQAEQMRGKIIYIDKSDITLPEGTYFVNDIIGLEAVDEQTHAVFGVVADVQEYPANDVWEIRQGEKSFLIPNVPTVVKRVCLQEGKVYIYPLKGLFENEN